MTIIRLISNKTCFLFFGTKSLLKVHHRQLCSKLDHPIAAGHEDYFSKEEWNEFHSLKPKLVSDIVNIQPFNKVPYLTSKIEFMLNYNLTGGKIASGLNAIYIYKMICKPEDRTPEDLEQAIIMGWCLRFGTLCIDYKVKLVNATEYDVALVIIDDILDSASIRYSVPSWPNLDNDAALHAMFTENCMHYLIMKYFSKHIQYKNILETILKATFRLNYAQVLDSVPYNENNLTEEFFETCSYGKFQNTTFHLSFSLPMYLANIQDPELYQKVRNITVKMGRWLHIQNDYLDAFDESTNRPIGKDIQLSRITWLSINAFHKSSRAQKKLFRENYGKDSEDSVNKIINLYRELRLPEMYEETERELQIEILKNVEDIPSDVIPHEAFFRPITNMKNRLHTF